MTTIETTIEITKKQNVRVDGVKYVARPAYAGLGRCTGCAFRAEKMGKVCELAPCVAGTRTDHHSVIFFLKKAPKAAS